jgi:hypothetical protein
MRNEALRSGAIASALEAAPVVVPKGPMGRVVTIVGPDGSGKTTLCAALVEEVLGDRHVRVLAHRRGASRPGLLPHRKVRGPTTMPHRHPPYPAWISVAKSLYVFMDLALGWFVRVRPYVRRGGWVVVERGWWDVAVDPKRYRLRPFHRLARLLGRFVPRSDIVLVLEAAPDVIRRRKAQLPTEELERQRHAWHRMLPAKQRRAFLDASWPASEVVRAASLELRALEEEPGGARNSADPSAEAAQTGDRPRSEVRWLVLLRRLTDRFPQWVVWKNADVALGGRGDIDVVAPAQDWDGIQEQFVKWASEQGLGPALMCRHVPGSMFLFAADPRWDAPFELDVKARGLHRGATVFRPADLVPLSVLDPRGFRRLRPGAEGMFKLILNGVKRAGRPRVERVASERVRELLASDPDGLREAALLFGVARAAAQRLAEEVARGRWRRGSSLLVEARARARAVVHPSHLMRRAEARLVRRRGCPGIKALAKRGGLSMRNLDAWPQDVLDGHIVEGPPE